MATITQIEIDGFKAFPKNFKLDLGTGKNLLLYGENGSGKSSLYYALHALLQSVFKDDRGAKYFKTGDTNGEKFIINNEHLINIFRFNEAKDNTYVPYVRITFNDGKIWRLDNGGLSSENGGNESEIRMLNRNSAFINHSYISRFHAARNSEEIDLWNVFYKDILPFHPVGTDHFLADIYDEIVSECNSSPKPRTSRISLKNKIVDFNSYLEQLVGNINKKASSIYNDYFRHVGEDELTIKIAYYKIGDQENKNNDYYQLYYGRDITGLLELSTPKIGIEIKENGKLILKPQSHFNEARLTAIALAVRFAAMSKTIVTGSFLALDDMLISLDMSNRMKVINYLFDKIAPVYKLYVFTHDRLFYHTLKRIIETQYKESEWIFGGIYVNDSIVPNEPCYVPDDKRKIEKIEDAYKCHDYFRCGTLLRQECERCLNELLPDSFKVKEDPKTGASVPKNLDELIRSLEEFCNHEQIDYTPFKDLKTYKDLFLNSTAHNDITSPFYRNEVKVCKQAITLLAQINRAKTIDCHRDLSIIQNNKKGENFTIRLRLREPLRLLEYSDEKRISYYNKCEILRIISPNIDMNVNEGYESIYVAYEEICKRYDLIKQDNLLDILQDRGELLRNKL